jgi:hypothetical protein
MTNKGQKKITCKLNAQQLKNLEKKEDGKPTTQFRVVKGFLKLANCE